MTILSLSLAVVLFAVTVTLVNSFDMDKYIANFTASDFILADAGQFQTGGDSFNEDMALPETAVDAAWTQGGIADGGRVYGRTSSVQEFVSEEYFRTANGWWSTPENLDRLVSLSEKTEDGRIADNAQLYGMEPFALDHLTVLEGICLCSMNREEIMSLSYTATMITAIPSWTATGPGWGIR